MINNIIIEAAKKAGFKKFSVKNGVYTARQWGASLKLYKDIAIVHKFAVLCNVADINDFSTKNVATLTSPENSIDYKHLVIANDVSGSLQLTSDFISVHSGEITISTTNAVWDKLYSGHLAYFIIKEEE